MMNEITYKDRYVRKNSNIHLGKHRATMNTTSQGDNSRGGISMFPNYNVEAEEEYKEEKICFGFAKDTDENDGYQNHYEMENFDETKK